MKSSLESRFPEFHSIFNALVENHEQLNKAYVLEKYNLAIRDLQRDIERINSHWPAEDSSALDQLRSAVANAKVIALAQRPPRIWFQWILGEPFYIKVEHVLEDLMRSILATQHQLFFREFRNFKQKFDDLFTMLTAVKETIDKMDRGLASSLVNGLLSAMKATSATALILPANGGSHSVLPDASETPNASSTKPQASSFIAAAVPSLVPPPQETPAFQRTVPHSGMTAARTALFPPEDKVVNPRFLLLVKQGKLKQAHYDLIKKLCDLSNPSSPPLSDDEKVCVVKLLINLLRFTKADELEIDISNVKNEQLSKLCGEVKAFDLTDYYASINNFSQTDAENFKHLAGAITHGFKNGVFLPKGDPKIYEGYFKNYANGAQLKLEISSEQTAVAEKK